MFGRWWKQSRNRKIQRNALQRPDQSFLSDSPANITCPAIEVKMCRFNAGGLETEIRSVRERYLAISHVWGEVCWQSLQGIKGEILVSEEKAKFMTERLPEILEGEWFWMDVLCIDQRDKAARIMVTQHIPTIYRFAQRTIIIREGTGFRKCCIEAPVGDWNWGIASSRWLVDEIFCTRINRHYATTHEHEDFFEGLLSRLWPLQEVLLSDTIQFVQCDCIQIRLHKRERKAVLQEIRNAILSQIDMMSYTWACYGEVAKGQNINDIGRMDIDFVEAFFNYGTVSRTGFRTAKIPPRLPNIDGFTAHINSPRKTSKPRDFILAWMPQFTFYTVPENAKSMTFSQLFADCFQQIRLHTKYVDFPPLLPGWLDISMGIAIPSGFEVSESGISKPDVPEPLYLGDLAKLFCGPNLTIKEEVRNGVSVRILRGYPVQVKELTNPNESDVIRAIEMSKRNAKAGLEVARIGDSEREIWYPEIPSHELLFDIDDLTETFSARGEPELLLRQAQFVLSLALYFFTVSPPEHQIDDITMQIFRVARPEALLRLTAVLVSGLGITAFRWSKRNVKPVIVHFNGVEYLGLVPYSVVNDECEHQFYLVVAKEAWAYNEGTRFVLVAKREQVADPSPLVICLFPPDIYTPRWNFWNRHANKLEKIYAGVNCTK